MSKKEKPTLELLKGWLEHHIKGRDVAEEKAFKVAVRDGKDANNIFTELVGIHEHKIERLRGLIKEAEERQAWREHVRS